MCVLRENVSDGDVQKFQTFVESLDEGELKQFLQPMMLALVHGGGFCLAFTPGEPSHDEGGDPPPEPGIYPPN